MLLLPKLFLLILLSLGFVIGLFGMCLSLRRRWSSWLGTLVLFVCSMPATNKSVWASLESSYSPQNLPFVLVTDAIVGLSGMLGGLDSDRQRLRQFRDLTDRLVGRVDLYHANKGPILIFTRGETYWSELPSEDEILSIKAGSNLMRTIRNHEYARSSSG